MQDALVDDRLRENRVGVMDEPTPPLDPPALRRCAICGEPWASYGFGPPGNPAQAAEAWYCGTHREEGERRWSARYRGTSLGPAVLL
jgi:hypothetical protein